MSTLLSPHRFFSVVQIVFPSFSFFRLIPNSNNLESPFTHPFFGKTVCYLCKQDN